MDKIYNNYYKWLLINQLLNSLRTVKGVELVPASSNPYKP